MSETDDDLESKMRGVAERAVQLYAREILTVELLVAAMMQEWEAQRKGEDEPSPDILVRISLRICSRELCNAWCSSNADICNRAFDNLKQYLTHSLQRTGYGRSLRRYVAAFEDVIHQTLEELYLIRIRKTDAGPNDPERFLKWAQVVMIHQAQNMLEKLRRDGPLSLDEKLELSPELFVDKSNRSPLDSVLQDELRQKLIDSIMSMHNPDYKRVLIETYLLGLEDRELAERMGVSVQKIYNWRCRALKALRNNPEVLELLHYLRE